ncbi:Phosphoserine aminotransferase [Hypsibius exemplaris]|uniref:Phosphoserine aminotransferase n=1 Tax=Hypsibius exemplaris TaxID=2072580 RepID=A0A1W0WSB0_HYPEX|nr:Phosphoserine aminotransferase [Hypsibius exemplaris]
MSDLARRHEDEKVFTAYFARPRGGAFNRKMYSNACQEAPLSPTFGGPGNGDKKRVLNFSPGPAKIPEEVLLQAQKELLNYRGQGLGVMEMSHRSKEFEEIIAGAEKSVRDLLHVPDNYKVLFLQGGGAGQFASVPLNLMQSGSADYLVSGSWSAAAAKEAEKYGNVSLVVPKPSKFVTIPDQSTWKLNDKADYFYYCGNETVHGVEFQGVPDIPSHIPIVADISSSLMSQNVDVGKYGLLFGGAQKNIGPAGVTLVVVRDDLLGHARKECPSVWDYKVQSANTSLYNTPPCFNVYITALILQWIQKNGGLDAMEALSRQKSGLIYDVIDKSNGFYSSPVDRKYRSRMNIPFRIGTGEEQDQLETEFLAEAKKHRMLQLKGHRSVGGMRASLYNAVTVAETQLLADLMKEFQDRKTDSQEN